MRLIDWIRGRSLADKVTAVSTLGIVLALGANVAVSSVQLGGEGARSKVVAEQDRDMRVTWSVIHGLGPVTRDVDGTLRAGTKSFKDGSDLVDEIKALTGGVVTIFDGDVRAATNVLDAAGARAVGTRLQTGAVHDSVFGSGHPFRGEADILGKAHFVAYDPIRGEDGSVQGAF